MVNASLPVYAEKKQCPTTGTGMQQSQVSLQGIFDDETKLITAKCYHENNT